MGSTGSTFASFPLWIPGPATLVTAQDECLAHSFLGGRIGIVQYPSLGYCGRIEIIGKVGIENIRAKSVRHTQRVIEGALARGWRVNSPHGAAERGGTVSVDCPHAHEVMRELIARDILVDYRPKAGIRLSPHFYNRDEEIDFALEQIEEILSTQAWERHREKSSVVSSQ